MGTVSSQSKDLTLKVSESLDESNEYNFKFNYIKNDSIKNKSSPQSETTVNSKQLELNDLIPIKFEWKDGGNDVKISGSFLENWKKQEPLQKNPITNIYEINLNLTKGVHQFKFIVNGKWVCSPYYNKVKDKDNHWNNEINTLNFINYNNSQENENTIINSSTKVTLKKHNKNTEYNSKIPDKNDFNSEAPEIPNFNRIYIDLNYNSNQGNGKFIEGNLIYNNSKNILENESFKSIMTISHNKLTHLFFNNNDINNDNKEYLRCAVTQRNKHKFLTLVYFSPKK